VSFEAEAHCIPEWLLGRKKTGYEWAQIAVLYPQHSIREQFVRVLAKHGTSRRCEGQPQSRLHKRAAVQLLSCIRPKSSSFRA